MWEQLRLVRNMVGSFRSDSYSRFKSTRDTKQNWTVCSILVFKYHKK